jgi:hypothetical protein
MPVINDHTKVDADKGGGEVEANKDDAKVEADESDGAGEEDKEGEEENSDGGGEDSKGKFPHVGKAGKKKIGKKNLNCLHLIFLAVHLCYL